MRGSNLSMFALILARRKEEAAECEAERSNRRGALRGRGSAVRTAASSQRPASLGALAAVLADTSLRNGPVGGCERLSVQHVRSWDGASNRDGGG